MITFHDVILSLESDIFEHAFWEYLIFVALFSQIKVQERLRRRLRLIRFDHLKLKWLLFEVSEELYLPRRLNRLIGRGGI
tara:strand:+ start:311 stop:550 length:240 start_codon:yes stop_codon:yes gene_type:complete